MYASAQMRMASPKELFTFVKGTFSILHWLLLLAWTFQAFCYHGITLITELAERVRGSVHLLVHQRQ
jgi:hypothetical protein